jgi:hypothetical protein
MIELWKSKEKLQLAVHLRLPLRNKTSLNIRTQRCSYPWLRGRPNHRKRQTLARTTTKTVTSTTSTKTSRLPQGSPDIRSWMLSNILFFDLPSRTATTNTISSVFSMSRATNNARLASALKTSSSLLRFVNDDVLIFSCQ